LKSAMIVEKIHDELKTLLKPKRLRHAEGVLDYSVMLAKRHGIDENSAKIAALYHDYFRNLKNDELLQKTAAFGIVPNEYEISKPILLHGKLAAADLLSKYPDIENAEAIAEAVKYHTSGYSFSSDIGKILFISDSVEVNRDFEGVERLRKMAMEDLDLTCFEIVKNKIGHSISKGNIILTETLYAYNKMIMNGVGNNDRPA